jgi:hypothetical protein
VRTHFLQKVLDARRAIYNLGKTVKSVAVEHILKEKSLVPTMVRVSNLSLYDTQKSCLNAFMECLSPMGFNIFSLLVVDILHEFDLGILKSVLKYLLRILHAVNPSRIHVVNDRYVLSHLYKHTNAIASW